jgi:uncharacterized membrane protein YphA (DoxX/SURF4 family)
MALGLEQRASLGWIGLLRIVTGGLFLWAGIEKLRSGFRGPALGVTLAAWAHDGRTFPFAYELVHTHVTPRLGDFAVAVVAGELVAGTSLFLGFASRLGAFVGLLLNVAYFLASRESINLLMAIVNLAVLVSAGGRALGLDGAIKARSPRWFLG